MPAKIKPVLVYEYQGGLYLNITNRCPVACDFCVKQSWNWQYRGQDLLIGRREPTARELCAAVDENLGSVGRHKEIVFCGFGEPTLRLDVMSEVGRHVRARRDAPPIRLNTVGLGSLTQGRDIVPELKPFLDSVSVSLNTMDPKQWEELHRPAPRWRGKGFAAAKTFIERCVAAGIRTRVTSVEGIGADLDAVRAYALAVGAEFLARPALER